MCAGGVGPCVLGQRGRERGCALVGAGPGEKEGAAGLACGLKVVAGRGGGFWAELAGRDWAAGKKGRRPSGLDRLGCWV
jgi:hypothetical protein